MSTDQKCSNSKQEIQIANLSKSCFVNHKLNKSLESEHSKNGFKEKVKLQKQTEIQKK